MRTALDDRNAKIIEEFRANDGKVGGQFEGALGPSCTTAAAPKGIRTIPVLALART